MEITKKLIVVAYEMLGLEMLLNCRPHETVGRRLLILFPSINLAGDYRGEISVDPSISNQEGQRNKTLF